MLSGMDVVVTYSDDGIHEVRVYRTRADSNDRQGAGDTAVPDPRVADDLARVARLRHAVTSQPDPARRLSALQRLATTADRRLVVEAAMAVLESDSSRALLEYALDVVRGEDSLRLEPLLKLAVGAREPTVRIKALNRLADQGARDPRIVETLRVLADDPLLRATARRLLESRVGQ